MNVLGRPFDLRSLLASSNNSVPYFYFLLLTSTVISVGISHARLLTKGKKPILTEILSVKFLKINLMLISKFMVQSYFVSIAVQSLMFKFVSKEGLTSKITLTWLYYNLQRIAVLLNSLTNEILTPFPSDISFWSYFLVSILSRSVTWHRRISKSRGMVLQRNVSQEPWLPYTFLHSKETFLFLIKQVQKVL